MVVQDLYPTGIAISSEEGFSLKSDGELHLSISEETDGTTEGMQPLASGRPSEPIESEVEREPAKEGSRFAECRLNEETLKVIRDAERGIGLFGPFGFVEHMLNSLLDKDEG